MATDGALANTFAPYLLEIEKVFVPTPIPLKLYKWVRREESEARALEVIGLTEQGWVVVLSTSIALYAADLAMRYKLSFADAIIYASARYHQVTLVTLDNHFDSLTGVKYFPK